MNNIHTITNEGGHVREWCTRPAQLFRSWCSARCFLVMLCACISMLQWVGAQDVPVDRLAEYRRIYEESCRKLRAQADEIKVQHRKQYVAKIKQGMTELKDRGELEPYLSVKGELDRVRAGSAISEDTGTEFPAFVRSAREEYAVGESRIRVAEIRERFKLTQIYVKRLKTLIREYMVAEKIDAAKAVNAELKRAKFLAAELAIVVAEEEKPSESNQDMPYPDDAVSHRGHHYKLYKESISWVDAKKRCEALDGHLVCIGDFSENDFVKRLVQRVNDVHIGATDEADEARWQWVNGQRWRYDKWGRGTPNGDRTQNFARQLKDGTWDDIDAGYKAAGFVCEWAR